jgi:predicted regulator of Ras-like GTPase activity (Roadblock/LC7/MglB family)
VNEVLDPLCAIPGVRCVVLATPDGVPIARRGELESVTGDDDARKDADDGSAVAGLVTGWLNALTPSLGLVSWETPQRVVLRASRGTLVVRRAPNAILIVVLEPGVRAEELRLPLEGAVNRLHRIARGPRLAAPVAALPARVGKGLAAPSADNASH